jgi:hypothetical protein
MVCSRAAKCVGFVLALAFACWWSLSPAGAVPVQDGKKGTVNCGDPGLKSICGECCVNDDCPCDQDVCLSCCLDDDGCDVVDDPPTTAITGTHIKVNAIVGNVKLQFERKGGTKGGLPSITVKLKQIFDTGDGKRIVTMKTRLTGADASLGGLLFPIAFLGLGTNALDAVRAQGLDVSFVDSPPGRTCQDVLPAQTCTTLASRLSASIDSALAAGDGVERTAFLTKAAAIGFPPCQIIL